MEGEIFLIHTMDNHGELMLEGAYAMPKRRWYSIKNMIVSCHLYKDNDLHKERKKM
jgi:hypothetical protein